MRYAIRWFKCKLKPPKNAYMIGKAEKNSLLTICLDLLSVGQMHSQTLFSFPTGSVDSVSESVVSVTEVLSLLSLSLLSF